MQNFLYDLIKNLIKAELDFVICGGVACILQGCERTTLDLDLNISLTSENIKKFITFCHKMNLRPRIPQPIEHLLDEKIRERWRIEKNALVYTVLSSDSLVQIDIFLAYPIEYKLLRKNADEFGIEGKIFYVSSKADLLHAKKKVKPVREKDAWDIRVLKELLENEKN